MFVLCLCSVESSISHLCCALQEVWIVVYLLFLCCCCTSSETINVSYVIRTPCKLLTPKYNGPQSRYIRTSIICERNCLLCHRVLIPEAKRAIGSSAGKTKGYSLKLLNLSSCVNLPGNCEWMVEWAPWDVNLSKYSLSLNLTAFQPRL